MGNNKTKKEYANKNKSIKGKTNKNEESVKKVETAMKEEAVKNKSTDANKEAKEAKENQGVKENAKPALVEIPEDTEEYKEKTEKMKKKIKGRLRVRSVVRFMLQLVKSLMLLAIFGGIGMYFAYESKFGNPDKIVDNVYECFAETNWNVLYGMSTIDESKFVNVVTFANGMGNRFADVDINTIKKKEIDIAEDKTTTITVTYKRGEVEEKEELVLVAEENKVHRFFPKWQLDISGYVRKNLVIDVPAGYDAKLDGIDLSDCDRFYMPSKQIMRYYVGDIFEGQHLLECQKEGMIPINQYVNVLTDDIEYTVDPSMIQMKGELVDTAKNIVFGMYECALKDDQKEKEKKLEDLKKKFSKKGVKDLVKKFDELQADAVREDGAYLKIIENVEYDVNLDNFVNGKSVDAIVHFSCTFWAKTARTDVTGIRKDYEGKADSTAIVHFIKKGSKYLATGVEIKCLDYSEANKKEAEEQ